MHNSFQQQQMSQIFLFFLSMMLRRSLLVFVKQENLAGDNRVVFGGSHAHDTINLRLEEKLLRALFREIAHLFDKCTIAPSLLLPKAVSYGIIDLFQES